MERLIYWSKVLLKLIFDADYDKDIINSPRIKNFELQFLLGLQILRFKSAIEEVD